MIPAILYRVISALCSRAPKRSRLVALWMAYEFFVILADPQGQNECVCVCAADERPVVEAFLVAVTVGRPSCGALKRLRATCVFGVEQEHYISSTVVT